MQTNTFKTLKLIANQNLKSLSLVFSLVMSENGLFLIYPIVAGMAIDAITKSQIALAMLYAVVVFIGWGLGAMRRKVDTIVFTRFYASLAVKVIMSEKRNNQNSSIIIARANISRELVNFFEIHFPIFFTSVISILALLLCFYLWNFI